MTGDNGPSGLYGIASPALLRSGASCIHCAHVVSFLLTSRGGRTVRAGPRPARSGRQEQGNGVFDVNPVGARQTDLPGLAPGRGGRSGSCP